MNIRMIAAGAALAAGTLAMQGADFFSTERCANLFDFGVRLGINTTNRTISDDAFPDAYHHENWGLGMNVGVVASLNIRDYLAIQPGFFYEYRSGTFDIMGTRAGSGYEDTGLQIAQAGKRTSHNFTIPVMAVFRFNLTDNIRWNVEAGPYVSFVFSDNMENKYVMSSAPASDYSPLFYSQPAPVDFGIKMGTGLQLFSHYWIGFHYMAGCLDAWERQDLGGFDKTFGGVTKGWTFSIGYDF